MELTHDNDPRDPMMGQDSLDLLTSPDNSLRVVCLKQVTETDQQELWAIVQGGFAALDSRSHERQSMTLEELQEDMESDDVLKYIAYDATAKPIGFMTVHVGLENVAWIDEDRFRPVQDESDASATSYYIGTLVVTPDARGGATAPGLVRSAMRHFRDVNQHNEQNSIAFFDCAHANYPWLAQMVDNMSQPAEDFEGVPVKVKEVGQDYWARDLANGETDDVIPEPKKMPTLPPGKYDVLDVQHYYAMEVLAA